MNQQFDQMHKTFQPQQKQQQQHHMIHHMSNPAGPSLQQGMHSNANLLPTKLEAFSTQSSIGGGGSSVSIVPPTFTKSLSFMHGGTSSTSGLVVNEANMAAQQHQFQNQLNLQHQQKQQPTKQSQH